MCVSVAHFLERAHRSSRQSDFHCGLRGYVLQDFEHVGKRERNAAFTLSGALNAITAFFGSLLAGFLPSVLMRASHGSLNQAGAYNAVLWLGVPAYLVSAFLMFKARSAPPVIEETHETIAKIQPPWGLLLFLGTLFVVQLLSENFVILFFNVYLNEGLSMPTDQIGVIFAVARLMPLFISPTF